MTTFNFEVSRKDQNGSDAIFKVNNWLLKLLRQRMRTEKMTQKRLAELLEVDKSTVSKMLRGNQNLTIRSVGEICGALGYDFDMIERDLKQIGQNAQHEHRSIYISDRQHITPNTVNKPITYQLQVTP